MAFDSGLGLVFRARSGSVIERFPVAVLVTGIGEAAVDLQYVAPHIPLGVETLDARFGSPDRVGEGAEIQSQPFAQAVVLLQLQFGVVIGIDPGHIVFEVPKRGGARAAKFPDREQVLLKVLVQAVL